MNNLFVVSLTSITFLTMLDVIVSKTKNGKVVKTVISLVAVTILLTPIVSIIKNFDINYDISANENYQNYLIDFESKVYKSTIKSVLEKNGYEVQDVIISFSEDNVYSPKKVTIKLKNTVINGQEEHINMIERVKTLLKTAINTENVEILIETTA